MMRLSQIRRAGQRGNASVEFAMSITLLWTVMSGIYQLGHALYIYNQLSVGLANAASFASRDGIPQNRNTYMDRIRNVSVYGNPEGTGEAMVRGLATSNIDVDITDDSQGVPRVITVSINSFPIPGVFWTTTLVDKPYSTVRYAGRYQPF